MKLDIKTQKALKWHLKQYCSACGGELHVAEKKLYDYSPRTGEPEYEYTIQCDNYRWWDIFTFHENSKYLVCAPTKLMSGKEHISVLER